MVKIVLDRDLIDRDYVSRYVSGVKALHEAIGPFELDYASRRSGVPAEDIERAAVLFATARTGGAHTGTGLSMAPHHNLATHLVMSLNALCGRYDRPGGLNRNEGPLGPRFDESSTPPKRPEPPKSRIRGIQALNGLFGSYIEMPTNTLTDEILTPGEGQIRALIVNGGNPALACSEEASAVRALKSLDLLVVNDLFRSATAEYADYIFAMKHPFERPDVPKLMDGAYPFPFGQYTPKLVDGPPGCLEEWEVFWGLAARLGLPMRVGPYTVDRRPTSDELLDALHARAPVSMEELRRHPSGHVYGELHTTAGGVIPNMIGHEDRRMAVGHPEVLAELHLVRGEPENAGGGYQAGEDFAFRLITYRMKEVYCTQGHNLPSLERKRPYNPLLVNPETMRELGLAEGDPVRIDSGHGQLEAFAEATDDLGRNVVALAFGWGDPSDPRGAREKGSNVQRLIPDDQRYDPVTGLAMQSAIPVNLHPVVEA